MTVCISIISTCVVVRETYCKSEALITNAQDKPVYFVAVSPVKASRPRATNAFKNTHQLNGSR